MCDATLNLDGRSVAVPLGTPTATDYPDSPFSQSQYVVYDESQVHIRYMVQFKVNQQEQQRSINTTSMQYPPRLTF